MLTWRNLASEVRMCILLLTLLVLCSCATEQGKTKSTIQTEPQQNNEQRQSKEPDDSSGFGEFFRGNSKGRASLDRFLSDGHYRVARGNDFNFSVSARKELARTFGSEWEQRIQNPYTGGEINDDEFYRDMAFIVVDTSRNDPQRFGLVIFNEEPGEALHSPFWLYKGMDLSTTVFGWARDGLHLEQYDEHGKYRICYINWHVEMREYTCGGTPKKSK